MGTDDVIEEVAEEVAEQVAEEVAEQVAEEVAEQVAEEVAESDNIEEVAEQVAAIINEQAEAEEVAEQVEGLTAVADLTLQAIDNLTAAVADLAGRLDAIEHQAVPPAEEAPAPADPFAVLDDDDTPADDVPPAPGHRYWQPARRRK